MTDDVIHVPSGNMASETSGLAAQKSQVKGIRATRGEWDKWGQASDQDEKKLNAWVRAVLNEASSYVLEHNASKHDARESRNQLLDVVRGRGPVSKYFDRR